MHGRGIQSRLSLSCPANHQVCSMAVEIVCWRLPMSVATEEGEAVAVQGHGAAGPHDQAKSIHTWLSAQAR
jgi:hypothetical protein